MGQVTIRNIGVSPYIGGLADGGMLSIRPGDVATVDEVDGTRILADFPAWFERVPSHGQEPAGEGPVSAGEGDEDQPNTPAAPSLAPIPPTEAAPAPVAPKKLTLRELRKLEAK